MIETILFWMGILAMLGSFATLFWVVPMVRNTHQWHVLGLCLFSLFFFGLGREMWLRSYGETTSLMEYAGVNSTGVIALWTVIMLYWGKWLRLAFNEKDAEE
jgi:hypothetical protein